MATLQERIDAALLLVGSDIGDITNEIQGTAKDTTLVQVRDKLILNDSQSAMMVGNARAKFRDGFKDLLEWDLIGSLGTGQSVSVAGSANGSRYVTFSSGTTANAETIYQSKETFSPPFKFSFGASASQNIANVEFHIELVEVDDTGALITDTDISTSPLFKDARNGMGFVFNGTTTSSALYKIRADGISEFSAAAAITKTQTGTSPNFAPTQEVTLLTQLDLCEGWTRTANIATIPTGLFHRKDYVPRPWAKYAIRLRVKNLGTAPASNTDFRVYWVNILDAARLSVDFGVTGGSQSADIAANVRVISAPSTPVTMTSTTVQPVTPATPYILNSAASNNGALIITGTSGLHAFYATNTGAAAAFVKLYNKATAPVVGTDIPAMIIPIPAAVSGVAGVATLPIGFAGFRFALGLGIAITANVADTDTAGVALGQVKVMLTRTT